MIVDFLPKPPESWVNNCIIESKPDDKDFFLSDNNPGNFLTIRLDGYAIIPRKKYEDLLSQFEKSP